MPQETITFTITGANGTQTKTVRTTVDPVSGQGDCQLVYSGSLSGLDSIQATATIAGKNYSSNLSQVAWQASNGLIGVGPVTVKAKAGASASGVLSTDTLSGTTTGNSLVFNEVVNGYPVSGYVSPDGRTGGYRIRPLSWQQQNANGVYIGSVTVAGTTGAFTTAMLGSLVVSTPGTYTIYGLADDGWSLFVGGGAQRLGGDLIGMNTNWVGNLTGYPVMGGRATTATSVQTPERAIVNFPVAGVYPFEIYYYEINDTNIYFTVAYLPGDTGPKTTQGDMGNDFLPVQTITPAPGAGVAGTGNLLLSPTGGASNLKVVGNQAVLNLHVQGIVYSSKSYIPLLEGNAGKLFLYNDSVNPTFTFQSYNGQAVDKTAASSTVFSLSGDNTSYQGRLSVGLDSTSGQFALSYNGAGFDSRVDKTNITVKDADVAWYNSVTKSFDLYTPSVSTGGDSYTVEVDYLVGVSVSAVIPATVPADGGQKQFTIQLTKPISPQQQGAFNTGNSISASVAMGAGVVVNSVTPNVDTAGWLTGWTVVATVPQATTNLTSNVNMTVTGNATFLQGNVFVTQAVTYVNAQNVANVALTGQAFVPPVAYSFSVSPKTATSGGYLLSGSVTLTAQVYTNGNDSLSLNFVKRPTGSSNQTTVIAGTQTANTTATVNNQTVWMKTFTATWATAATIDPSDQLGFVATDATSGMSVTYWDVSTYFNNNSSGGGTGAGCPALEMFVSPELQVSDAREGTTLVCLPNEHCGSLTLDYEAIEADVEWVKHSVETCYHFVTENGASIIVSGSTPVPTHEALTLNQEAKANGVELDEGDISVFAQDIHVGMHVITDVGNGLEWSRLVQADNVGLHPVARLYVGDRNFRAGVEPGKYIFTHNVTNINVK